MKTKVITNCKDHQHNEWQKSERGYIDGYVRGGDDTPLACVVIDKRLILIPLHCLIVITDIK